MKRIVATKTLIEKTRKDLIFKNVVNESLNKFQKNDWGDAPIDEDERNNKSLSRGWGLVLGIYKYKNLYINVFMDGKHEKITICFGDEIL